MSTYCILEGVRWDLCKRENFVFLTTFWNQNVDSKRYLDVSSWYNLLSIQCLFIQSPCPKWLVEVRTLAITQVNFYFPMKKYYHYVLASVTCKQELSAFILIPIYCSIIHQTFIEYLLQFCARIGTSAVKFWDK